MIEGALKITTSFVFIGNIYGTNQNLSPSNKPNFSKKPMLDITLIYQFISSDLAFKILPGTIQVYCASADYPQSIRMDLNKKSKPKQKAITALKGTP